MDASLAVLDLLSSSLIDGGSNMSGIHLNQHLPELKEVLDGLGRLAATCSEPEKAQQMLSMIERSHESLKVQPPEDFITLEKIFTFWSNNRTDDAEVNSKSIQVSGSSCRSIFPRTARWKNFSLTFTAVKYASNRSF